MTQAAPISSIIPRDYDIFGGLDVDKKSMAVTFRDHGTMRKSLKLPYSASQLLNYTPHSRECDEPCSCHV
ncbi:MAG: hypothetical protein LC770_07765 [Acidobacteria bacterium]|nr:hypothetical protein [Acidobacteriota bacterium]